ncbi:hypothetical protein [uncultured Friedmanniella sp.]|uniref:hypothetical protein n=1 Tax=uncultured Friedmanniella sp. TaxID=335381 RepID=UPI0035CA5E69
MKSIIDGFDGTYNDLIDTVNGILDGSFKGWLAHTEDGDHVHVTPFNDLLEHEVDDDGSCVCGPTIEPAPRNNGSYGWSIIHHTLDGRESAES